jgi:hypothetical protein
LSEAERSLLLLILNSVRFADLSPAAVFAILLDEGRYHGSVRTMYRLLAAQGLSGERRSQRVHPVRIPSIVDSHFGPSWTAPGSRRRKPPLLLAAARSQAR